MTSLRFYQGTIAAPHLKSPCGISFRTYYYENGIFNHVLTQKRAQKILFATFLALHFKKSEFYTLIKTTKTKRLKNKLILVKRGLNENGVRGEIQMRALAIIRNYDQVIVFDMV